MNNNTELNLEMFLDPSEIGPYVLCAPNSKGELVPCYHVTFRLDGEDDTRRAVLTFEDITGLFDFGFAHDVRVFDVFDHGIEYDIEEGYNAEYDAHFVLVDDFGKVVDKVCLGNWWED